MSKKNIFILSWDCYGLEGCVDITEQYSRAGNFEKESLFDRLKDPDNEPHNSALSEINKMVNVMMLRARFNPQRNYEIYIVNTDQNICEEDLRTLFEENPQYSAELIRNRGIKLYSDRSTTKRVIV